MLIAVASKSGTDIDQHFGHAEQFRIYDFRSGGSKEVAIAEVEKYCSFDPDHPFRHNKLQGILDALQGCRAVVTAQIGELPRLELEKHGLTVISATGPIEPALRMAHDAACGCNCNGEKRRKGECAQQA